MAMEIPNLNDSKGMLLEGVAASSTVDSSGEIVDIDGLNIESLEAGDGTVNIEHVSSTDGLSKETVGVIVYAKKILQAKDAVTDSQKHFLKETRGKPYLYIIARLFDASGHAEAKAIAAQIRDYEAHGQKPLVRWSVEGSTIEKKDNRILQSIARKVSLTITPCNKTAVSRILLDPQAPNGYSKVDRLDMAKSEFMQDPSCRPIGSAVDITYNPILGADRRLQKAEGIGLDTITNRLIKNVTVIAALKKTLTAGSGECAPGALTQGAALQKEDLGNVYKNNVLGAVRDYGNEPWDRQKFKQHLKKYLAKAQLPEVSESFLNHFVDIAESAKLKKSVDDFHRQQDLYKKEGGEKPVLASPSDSVIEDDHTEIPETPQNLTFRGKKLKTNPKVKRLILDTNKGVLHTPYGSLKLHNPATEAPEVAQHFQDLMNSPHTNKIMGEALKGWHQVHQLNKAGELPEEIPMTATILSTCSGNRPVPLTELQTVRIVDAIRNSGIDPRKPGFENIMPHLKQLDKPDVLPQTGGEAIGKDPAYFIGNKIGVEKDLFGDKAGEPNPSGRYPGELKAITPLLEDTVKNLSQYYKAHKGLVDLVGRHKTDMASGIRELMGMKQARTNWNNTRRKKIAEGKPDPGEYKGLNIPGIKLKTGLYSYGMMGGSNSVIPDTHFIRHMFGLDTRKDAKTLLYLKKALWNPNNYPIIEKYNDWYRANHPAHSWMVNHPEFGKMFDKPEDATFPAFWANWINISPYEQKLGTSVEKHSHNKGSTHAPYWAAIEPQVNEAMKRLGKSSDFDTTMPLRAALVMQHYVRDYGEIPAQLLYYQHLVPKLLECAKNRQDSSHAMSFLRKAMKLEEQLIELRKDIRHVVEGGHSVEMPEVYQVALNNNGKLNPAGRFMTSRGKLYHLEDYHGLLNSMVPEGPIDASTISRIHGLMLSPHFDVTEHPMDTTHLEATDPKSPPVASVTKQPEPKMPGVFSYFRPGMSKPHTVEFSPDGAALDGKALTHEELTLMLSNARKGLAQVKWHTGEDLNKSERLAKKGEEELTDENPMDQDEALQHVRAAVKAGHVHPSVERALTKHIYEDPMVQGVGNKYSAQKFREQNKPGVYASIDANDFKAINDVHGHDAGDDAIRALGGALREAGKKVGHGFIARPGGDEFLAVFPTHEHMAKFLRHAREHVEALPPIAGAHRQSFSVGLGHNFAVADQALRHAKEKKLDPITKQRLYVPGHTPNLGHSLYPGHEGDVFQQEVKPPKMAVG